MFETWRNLASLHFRASETSAPRDSSNRQKLEGSSNIAPNNCGTTDLSAVLETQRTIATSDLDLNTVMQVICERAKNMTGASGAFIAVAEGDRMVYKAASDSIRSHLGSSLPIANSFSGLCFNTGELLQCHDADNDPRVNRQACCALGIGSMIVVPLWHQGKTVGVLKLISPQKNHFKQAPVDLLQLLAGIIAAALSNSLITEENRKLNRELKDALSTAKQLNGVLPMCCECKKIHDDSGAWKPFEIFIAEHSELRFSHGYCPQCAQEFRKEAGLKNATE